jgi:hypothetical protein
MPLSRTKLSTLRSSGAFPSSSLQMNTVGVGVRPVGDEGLGAVEEVLVAVAAEPSDRIDPKASDPDPGSVMAHAPTLSMVRRSSAQRSFCAIVPRLMIAGRR